MPFPKTSKKAHGRPSRYPIRNQFYTSNYKHHISVYYSFLQQFQIMKEQNQTEFMHDGVKILFDPTHCYASELGVLKRMLQEQFNGGKAIGEEGQWRKIFRQVIFMRFRRTKEALLYFTMSFKGKEFVDQLKEFQRVDSYKGKRGHNMGLLAKILKNIREETQNPVIELYSAARFLVSKKEIIQEALFNYLTHSQAKQRFYTLIDIKDSSKVRECFFKLNFNLIKVYPEGKEGQFLIRALRKAKQAHKVGDEERNCYVYLCPQSVQPRMGGFWIVALQAYKTSSVNNEIKTLVSYEQEDFIQKGQESEQEQKQGGERMLQDQTKTTFKYQPEPQPQPEKNMNKAEEFSERPRQFDKVQLEILPPKVLGSWGSTLFIVTMVIFIIVLSIFNVQKGTGPRASPESL